MRYDKWLLGAMMAVPLALAAHQASAAVVTFNSSGAFSNITNCNSGSPGCSISSSGGTNNVLDMSGANNSTLTANTFPSTNLNTNQNDFVIGSLTWVNNASTNTDQDFGVTYTFALNFTAPSGSSDTQAFVLNITQPTNPPGDNVLNISNATLAGLGPFALAGVTVSDLKFSLALGDTATYNGSTWSNPENHTSLLRITADFTAVPVPEPTSMALLGSALLGMGWAHRRRRNRA